MKRWFELLCACACAYLALSPASASAANYPDRPVYWVVPWAPGGASDTVGRLIGEQLGKVLKQPVIVENRPGAGGNIGTEMVARAAPDGYTLVQLTDATTISPGLYASLKYDPVRAFAPITLIATGPHVLVAPPASPDSTLADLVERAKKNPGAVNYATAGVGSAQHLAIEMFKRVAHIEMTHGPYKGGGQAIGDVVSGQVPVGACALAPVRAPLQAGESGFPGFSSVQWFGLAAPAGTPAAVVSRLNRDVVGVLRTPAVGQRLQKLGATVVADTPEQFAHFIEQDTARWSSIIKDSGIKLE